jgi:hypothetical protein
MLQFNQAHQDELIISLESSYSNQIRAEKIIAELIESNPNKMIVKVSAGSIDVVYASS